MNLSCNVFATVSHIEDYSEAVADIFVVRDLSLYEISGSYRDLGQNVFIEIEVRE